MDRTYLPGDRDEDRVVHLASDNRAEGFDADVVGVAVFDDGTLLA